MQGKQPFETAGSGTTGTDGHTVDGFHECATPGSHVEAARKRLAREPQIDKAVKVELLNALNVAHRVLTTGVQGRTWTPELTALLDALDGAVMAVYIAAGQS